MTKATDSIEAHVQVDSATDNAIDLLEKAAGLSRQRIKFAMTQGAVWLTRKRNTRRLRRARRTLEIGDELHLYYNAEVLSEIPPKPDLLDDVGDYSVWQKPYGLRSQGSRWGDHCTLTRWAERNLQPQRSSFTVHRLDRAASGLMVIAHTKTMAAKLSALFQQRAIEKQYRATVSGDCSAWANPLRIDQPVDGKSAVSEVSLVEYCADKNQSTVDVRIETGRKHQIRRHLAQLGHPVIGDRLYGNRSGADIDLQLIAYRLAFDCPVRERWVEYRLPLD